MDTENAVEMLQAMLVGCHLNNTIQKLDTAAPALVLGSKIAPHDDMIIRITDGQAFLSIKYVDVKLPPSTFTGLSLSMGLESYREVKFRGVDLCDPDLFEKVDTLIDDAITWSRGRPK